MASWAQTSQDLDTNSTEISQPKITYSDTGFVVSKATLDSPVTYNARDSIVVNLDSNLVSLFGQATVKYGSMNLTAGKIEMDLETSIVRATFLHDSLGEPIEKPVFVDGGQEMRADTILYNFETKRGKVKKVYTQESESYIHMEISTLEPNKEVHMRRGKYTTCSLEEPHFHFQMSKAVLVPSERIASGPMNVYVGGVPTPIALPFAIFPFPEKRTHGILPPSPALTQISGIGLVDLGYYIPLGDNWQTTFYGTIYSKGNWGLKNATSYKKKYGYAGGFNLEYFQRRLSFPDKGIESQSFNVKWKHQLDPKANPYWRFNANVDFRTDNNPKNSIDPINNNYLNNQLKSDIQLSRIFKTNPSMSFTMNLGMVQSSTSGNIDFNLPTIAFNVNRWLFLEKVRAKDGATNKWYHGVGLTYSMNAVNTARIPDSVLFGRGDYAENTLPSIGSYFSNGVQHNFDLNTTAKLGKRKLVSLTPSLRYIQYWNFQEINKYVDTAGAETFDTIRGNFGFSQAMSTSLNMTTNLYGMYSYRDKKKSKMLHTITPNLGVSYVPYIGAQASYIDADGEEVFYNPYERSARSQSYSKDQGIVNLGFRNKFELKTKTKKDTTDEQFSKFILVDNFSVNGNYDIMADSFNFSDITFQLNMNPVHWLSINGNMSFTPYGWDTLTGAAIDQWAWNTNKELGRVERGNIGATFRLAPKVAKERFNEIKKAYGGEYQAELDYLLAHPDQYYDFAIPWSLNLTYTMTFSRSQYSYTVDTISYLRDTSSFRHQITFNGDLNFTPNWKVRFSSGFDINELDFTYTRISIIRNLHCWQFVLDWIPFGTQQGFMFTMKPTATMLQDMKLKRQRPPIDF